MPRPDTSEHFAPPGYETEVFEIKSRPDLLLAIDRGSYSDKNYVYFWSKREALTVYSIHRIFNVLFPNNFPRIHAVFGKDYSFGIFQKFVDRIKEKFFNKRPDSEIYGSIRQKIVADKSLTEVQKTELVSDFYYKLNEFTNETSVPVWGYLDSPSTFSRNIVCTKDSAYYVDWAGIDVDKHAKLLGKKYKSSFIRRISLALISSEEKIFDYMTRRNYTEDDINIVKNQIKRLRKLNV
jgi:hypothetical protein